MLKVKQILIDYLKDPVGVTEVPQFSWELESGDRGVRQRSYHLQVSRGADFGELIYDSGEVQSDQSAQVRPQALRLISAARYYARVRVAAENGEDSCWSAPATFVTGLLGEEEWSAAFISGETEEHAGESDSRYLRSEFCVEGNVLEAYACTTALGLYHFYLNGKKVGEDEMAPGWTSYHNQLMYQVYDVTEYLRQGVNAAGAFVGAGWYKGVMGFVGNRNNYGKQTAFLGQLILRMEDGSTRVVATDGSWKSCRGPAVFSEIYDGETYDARLEQKGWNEPGFDENGWEPVQILEQDFSVLRAQAGCRVRVMDRLPAGKIFTTPEGDLVVDFGQNLTGWIETRVKGRPGDKLQLHCFETLDADGNVYTANLRLAKETLTYICGEGGETVYRPWFSFQGFRYAKIEAFPGTPCPEDFTACAVHSQMEETGTFHCSNPLLNQLQHNITWGLKGNFLDVPTDCPQRNERLGWTGDAQIFCRTASYLMNTYTFFSKWLKDVAADQMEDGGVPHVVPDIVTGCSDTDWLVGQGTYGAAAWGDVAVINPWTLYLTYGDRKILEDQYDSMKAWIDFMQAHENEEGIWSFQLQFGDWVALDAEEGSYFGATPTDLTCTAYYAYSSGIFAKIAGVLGREEDASFYQSLHNRIVKVFQEHYFDRDGNLTAQTQTAHIVALYFGLVPEEYQEKTACALVRLLKKENGHLVTGFIGTPYFCHALSSSGHLKEAYELLLKEDFPSWLYQVKAGATTVWEHWDGIKPDGTMWSPDMNSFNHYAYGAIGEWLYRVAAGIEIDENAPAYRHSILHPRMGGGLTEVSASYHSVYGKVAVNWKQDQEKVTLDITVPHNTTATVRLDSAKQVLEGDGVDFAPGNGFLEGRAGSGNYRFIFVQ